MLVNVILFIVGGEIYETRFERYIFNGTWCDWDDE